jgi:hypothetical protein
MIIKRKVSLLALALLTTLIRPVSASADITYAINVTAGVGSVTGTVTTDGTLGILGTGDFIAWDLNLNGNGASTTITSADVGRAVLVLGTDVSATASALYFNYSGLDNGILVFQDHLFSGETYWCNSTSTNYYCDQGVSIAPESAFSSSFVNVGETGNQIIGSAPAPVPGAGLAGLAFLMLAGLLTRARGFLAR